VAHRHSIIWCCNDIVAAANEPKGEWGMAKLEWGFANRSGSDRSDRRYPSDVTDAEWGLIEHIIPPAKRGGNKRTIDTRRVVDGLLYVLSSGCQWTSVPQDLPPRTTLNDYFRRWCHDGTLVRIHQALSGIHHVPDQRSADPIRSKMATPDLRVCQGWTMPGAGSPATMRDTNPGQRNSASW
jgi:transposase